MDEIHHHKSPRLAPPKESTNMSSLSHEIRDFDQEISRHEQIILDLKFKRNSRLHIFQLPAEILCIIVQHTQDRVTDPLIHGNIRLPRELSWITITHVCKHWRDVTINQPSLWTIPPLRNPKWASLMLQRSRMAGVTFFFDQESLTRRGAMESVDPHFGHTEALIVEQALTKTLKKLLAHLELIPAPRLQKLVLKAQERDGGHSMLNTRRPLLGRHTLPQSVNLRHLSLVAVDVDWSSRIFSSLTTLSIAKVSDGARPSASQFMDVLQMMPNLATLLLENVLPKHTALAQSDPLLNHRRVNLSALKDLRVVSEATECEFLWNHISTSSTISHVSVVAMYSPWTSSSFATLLAAIYGSDTCHQFETSSRSVLVYASPGGIEGGEETAPIAILQDLELFITNKISKLDRNTNDNFFPDQRVDSSEVRFNVTAKALPASTGHEGQPESTILTDLYNVMRWNNLRELNLVSSELWPSWSNTPSFPQTLASTFGTLYRVQTVTIGQYCAKPFVEALLIGSEQDPAVSPSSIPFPGLRFIKFLAVIFDARFNSYGLTSGLLRDCLMSRYERGVEVRVVSIINCYCFGLEKLRLSEEIVVDVHWDCRNTEPLNESEYDDSDIGADVHSDDSHGYNSDW